MRLLIVARFREEARDTAQGAAAPQSREEWERLYAPAIEGIDYGFDNGAGAFLAVAEVPDQSVLSALLADYPYAAWVDVEIRRLPALDEGKRRAWRALAAETAAALAFVRGLGLGAYREYQEQALPRWKALLARAEALAAPHP